MAEIEERLASSLRWWSFFLALLGSIFLYDGMKLIADTRYLTLISSLWICFGVFSLALPVGLLRRKEWARRSALLLCYLHICFTWVGLLFFLIGTLVLGMVFSGSWPSVSMVVGFCIIFSVPGYFLGKVFNRGALLFRDGKGYFSGGL
jgi:hypothetical protein